MSDDSGPTQPPDPTDPTDPDPIEPDPAEDEEAAHGGRVVLYFWGSLLVFGAFLVVVPGQRPAGRTWLWVGAVLLVTAVSGLTVALRARIRHAREDGQP